LEIVMSHTGRINFGFKASVVIVIVVWGVSDAPARYPQGGGPHYI
jgi:hypothetical protein